MIFSPTRVAATVLRVLPRKTLSRALGGLTRLAAQGMPVDAAVRMYSRAYKVDLSECEVPEGGFPTFDAFFTRALKPGVRPVDPDPLTWISPADGRLEDLGVVEPTGRFVIKGSEYTLAELLGEEDCGERFWGGQFAVIYLSPRDYHRVHAPASGKVVRCRHIPGTLYPVNQIGLAHIPRLFARNERVAIHQEVGPGSHMCTVMVGAIGVGRITVEFEPQLVTNGGLLWGLRAYSAVDAPMLERGQELGRFHMGSTVIVFTEPNRGWRFLKGAGDSVRMGEAVARQAGA